MTDAKPLSAEELHLLELRLRGKFWMCDGRCQELCERVPATIRRLGELIAWFNGRFPVRYIAEYYTSPLPEYVTGWTPNEQDVQNATEILAIVAGLEQD